MSVEEIDYLKTFSSDFGIIYNLDKEIINVDEALSVFSNRQSEIILLQELIKLSYRDGHFKVPLKNGTSFFS